MLCRTKTMVARQSNGFTLAELLIALAILGVIATFTIPKVLQSQQDAKFTAIGKEAAAMISGAYSAFKVNGSLSASTTTGDLTPYMNYVSVDTASTIDFYQTQTSDSCNVGSSMCLRLHNGAVLKYLSNVSFGGTATTNAIFFRLDPDGVYSNTTDGPGKAVALWVYYNGRIRTYGTIEPGTEYTAGSLFSNTPLPDRDPPWFSWD